MPPTPSKNATAPDGTDENALTTLPEKPESSQPSQTILDKSEPVIADAFQDCKVGDTYTVVQDDGDTVTLEYHPGGDAENATENATDDGENGDENNATTDGSAGYDTGNTAVDKMVKAKMGR